MRRDEAISLALSAVYSPATADEVWRKHLLLCDRDDEYCGHVEEVVQALVSEIEGFDEKLEEKAKEAREDERKEVEEALGDAHAEKVKELEDRIAQLEADLEKAAPKIVVPVNAARARESAMIDLKTAALSEGRREVEVWLLGRLRESLNGSAKDLRREVHGLVVELIKRVNGSGP